jgi:hypothetical protein
MPEAGWLETSLAASSCFRSQARPTNSVEKLVKILFDPVS